MLHAYGSEAWFRGQGGQHCQDIVSMLTSDRPNKGYPSSFLCAMQMHALSVETHSDPHKRHQVVNRHQQT